jgi:hypothetical protein
MRADNAPLRRELSNLRARIAVQRPCFIPSSIFFIIFANLTFVYMIRLTMLMYALHFAQLSTTTKLAKFRCNLYYRLSIELSKPMSLRAIFVKVCGYLFKYITPAPYIVSVTLPFCLLPPGVSLVYFPIH